MKLLAITDARYRWATRQVVRGLGAEVVVCPPDDATTLTAKRLQGYDALYIDLHGLAGTGYLLAGKAQDLPALSVNEVRQADLKGVVVFATTCFLPQTPFLQAFRDAGATVIAGEGENFGGRWTLSGAQSLARAVFEGLARQAGDALATFTGALERVRGQQTRHKQAQADALTFRLWGPQEGNDVGEVDTLGRWEETQK